MFLDGLLGTVLRQNPDQPVTWKDLGALIKMQQDSMHKVSAPDPKALTDREIKLIQMMCEGKETEEIAKELYIAPRTCETLRITLKKKIGAKNIAQIVIYAVKAGIITVE
jgi:DNA-binding NarL/FixJ family response regulator